MSLLAETMAAIPRVDPTAAVAMQQRLDGKTKPRRSLGQLETVACQLASIYRTASFDLPAKAIVVMVGDHGVVAEGVSAYPQEVTTQMVKNFAAGGAAINVLARQAGARLVVVDMGTKVGSAGLADVLDRRLGPGTANFMHGPAMDRAVARRAVEVGIELATQLAEQGIGLIGVGEMGIGNTTAASAVTAALTGAAPAEVTGRGTGIDEEHWQRKVRVVETALHVNRLAAHDALAILAGVGGFEIAGLAGVILGAAARRLPIVLDGFITGAAALAAVGLCPIARDYLIAAHRSVEPGHAVILRTLGLRPLLDLDLRLGEGTGAALAMSLLHAAVRISREMASFESAGVTDAGK